MVYMVIGVLFVIICGFDLAYTTVWLTPEECEEPELEGHPVKFNKTGALIPVIDPFYVDVSEEPESKHTEYNEHVSMWKRRAIIYMALINSGVLVALGGLAFWHGQLISRGETSIEANINRTETKRLAEMNKVYVNPYDFGKKKNWRIFLGVVRGKTFVRNVLFPSAHEPVGDGLTWYTVHDQEIDNWP